MSAPDCPNAVLVCDYNSTNCVRTSDRRHLLDAAWAQLFTPTKVASFSTFIIATGFDDSSTARRTRIIQLYVQFLPILT